MLTVVDKTYRRTKKINGEVIFQTLITLDTVNNDSTWRFFLLFYLVHLGFILFIWCIPLRLWRHPFLRCTATPECRTRERASYSALLIFFFKFNHVWRRQRAGETKRRACMKNANNKGHCGREVCVVERQTDRHTERETFGGREGIMQEWPSGSCLPAGGLLHFSL